MKQLATAYCQTPEQFFEGNGQEIREIILRQAVKSCEHYSTDILIFFDSEDLKNLLQDVAGEVRIWFRSMGVEWGHPLVNYRYVMKLTKAGNEISLFGEIGNV